MEEAADSLAGKLKEAANTGKSTIWIAYPKGLLYHFLFLLFLAGGSTSRNLKYDHDGDDDDGGDYYYNIYHGDIHAPREIWDEISDGGGDGGGCGR